MDLHFASSCSSPFTYLVSEHARAVVAIQELQREVNSLLSFREHVLEALPHLQLRGDTSPHQEAAPRPVRPPSAPNSGKSLSEGTSTVVDSGFSTDKASTSMGKSSSSSSGELSGGNRWTCGDLEASGGANPPLGSAEDELWQLLEVIQRKGSKLRRDLERAEATEREYGHVSDPLFSHSQPPLHYHPNRIVNHPVLPGRSSSQQHNQQLRDEEPFSPPPPGNIIDWWPHSLPGGAGPRFDFVPGGIEAWGEMERLRQDRMYLMGRLSRAESEATTTHQRLLDLHSQLVSLASEKRRLEDAFRTLKVDNPYSDINQGVSSKVSVSGNLAGALYKGPNRPHLGPFSVTSVRIGEDVILPRVLKVPIKDKNDGAGSSVISRQQKPSRIPQVGSSSPAKTINEGVTTPILLSVKEDSSSQLSTPYSVTAPSTITKGDRGNRVVIERQRNANRIDGGLSMPASLLKGARINVKPNKQRISAILKEKDVLSLQRHLLTTVMETEVLRRQIEVAGEEWSERLAEWETGRQKSIEVETLLKQENLSLKEQLENHQRKSISNTNVGVWATPTMRSVGVGTDNSDSDLAPSYSVHQGPNVKYDVVIYEEGSSSDNKDDLSVSKQIGNSKNSSSTASSIEKPPRRTRPLSGGASQHQVSSSLTSSLKGQPETSFGRDSLGRVAKIPLKPHRTPTPPTNSARTLTSTTPTSTPRSSPASSISGPTRYVTGRPTSTQGLSPATRYVARRDSMKVVLEGPPTSVTKGSGNPITGTIKNGKNGGLATANNATKGSPNGGINNSVGPPTPTHKSVLSSGNGNTRRPTNSRKFLKDISLKSQANKTSRSLERENSQLRKERALHVNSLKSESDSRTKEDNSRHWPAHDSHFYGTQNTACDSRKDSKISPYIDGWGAPTPHYLNGSGANYSWANFMHDRYCLWSPDHNTKDKKNIIPSVQEDDTVPIESEEESYCPFVSDSHCTNRLNSHPIKLKGDQLCLVNDYTQTSSSFYRSNESNKDTQHEDASHVHFPQEVVLSCSPHKVIRRTLSGALRIKNNDRPSVLPTLISKKLSPLVLRGALDDVNYRVEQILSQIAAKNATY